jgi:hypothetical protein
MAPMPVALKFMGLTAAAVTWTVLTPGLVPRVRAAVAIPCAFVLTIT